MQLKEERRKIKTENERKKGREEEKREEKWLSYILKNVMLQSIFTPESNKKYLYRSVPFKT